MGERRYSEAELAAILRDAAERSTADHTDYSLTDIQRIAGQAQIAPEHVANAAGALTVRPAEAPSPLWGEPSGIQLVRRVDNPVTAGDVVAALSLARQRLGETGTTRDVAGGSEWRYDTGYSGAAITIVPDGGATIVRVDARSDGRQFILYFGAAAVTALTGFIASSATTPTFSALAAAAALLPSLAVARTWWNRSARSARQSVTALADEIAATLTRSTPDRPD
ncbi:MAG: hypothetical protein V4813_10680 [Gemmatimonadota bacterium]